MDEVRTNGIQVCSLPGADLSERVTEWETLAKRALVGASRTADIAIFRFDKQLDVQEELLLCTQLGHR